MHSIPPSWFSRDATIIAKELLGKVIEYKGCSGMIVETEAYMSDEASHGFKLTPRSKIMHETHGHVYVYFIYGMYYCLNFTTNKDSVGAVLIRALEPLEGVSLMQKRRKVKDVHQLMSGPGKVCRALKISTALNGSRIGDQLKIYAYKNIPDIMIGCSSRIGISRSQELEWRFFIKNNPFVSKH